MQRIDPNVLVIAAAALAAVGVVWWVSRSPSDAGKQVGKSVVEFIGGAVGSAVIETGKFFGVPETDPLRCAQALKDGRFWDASFDCPVKDFVGGVFSREPAAPAAPDTSPRWYGVDADLAPMSSVVAP